MGEEAGIRADCLSLTSVSSSTTLSYIQAFVHA